MEKSPAENAALPLALASSAMENCTVEQEIGGNPAEKLAEIDDNLGETKRKIYIFEKNPKERRRNQRVLVVNFEELRI